MPFASSFLPGGFSIVQRPTARHEAAKRSEHGQCAHHAPKETERKQLFARGVARREGRG
jgi:hypothetical protein